MEELISKIKKKKELSGISDPVVLKELNKIVKNKRDFTPKEEKLIIKEVRSKLRRYVGQYQSSLTDRKKLLDQRDFTGLLKTHSSTKERLNFYPELKKKISNLKPKSILDLGCGLNPLAIATKEIFYFASDIRLDELEIINQFFKKNSINGKTFVHDLRSSPKNLPEADLCLIFKVFDIIDSRKSVEEILSKSKCKTILASFSTKKLSGKPMNQPRRFWFEKILKKLNFNYQTFSSDNEIFYEIKKTK